MTRVTRHDPPAVERDPKWITIGAEIRAARTRLGLSQSEMGRSVNGLHQTNVSRDEAGNGMPYDRLKIYCDFFKWDYDSIITFLKSTPAEQPPVVHARREYFELFQLLDGKLLDAEEQDLIDEALQLVILHRYPSVKPADFTSPEGG